MSALKPAVAGLLVCLVTASASAASAPSLDSVLPIVERQLPGAMLDARGPARSSEGALVYQIKWLTPDGRVVWLIVDTRTGKVSG